MTEKTVYSPGTFCWVDLGTTDAESAKSFYGQLFGWTMTDTPAGPDMTYTMITKDGQNVGGLYQMPQQMIGDRIPPHWLSYVSVEDVAASTEKLSQLGGTVLSGPMDVMTAGKMAAVKDVTGAAFALWEPVEHVGADHVNAPGGFCWNELATRDTARAGQFYTELFGWSRQDVESTMGPYTTFSNGERPAGGMLLMNDEWPSSVPAHWLVYFAVEDCDSSAERARELGGNVLMDPFDIQDVGRFTVIDDPQGAGFAIIAMPRQI